MNILLIKHQVNSLKNLLLLPGTDFLWSNYDNAQQLIQKLDCLVYELEQSERSAAEQLLFLLAPTGAIQEISLQSGWGNEFLAIAEVLETELKACLKLPGI